MSSCFPLCCPQQCPKFASRQSCLCHPPPLTLISYTGRLYLSLTVTASSFKPMALQLPPPSSLAAESPGLVCHKTSKQSQRSHSALTPPDSQTSPNPNKAQEIKRRGWGSSLFLISVNISWGDLLIRLRATGKNAGFWVPCLWRRCGCREGRTPKTCEY